MFVGTKVEGTVLLLVYFEVAETGVGGCIHPEACIGHERVAYGRCFVKCVPHELSRLLVN